MLSKNKTVSLVTSIVVCQLAGGLGSIFTFSAIPDWYRRLTKPSFTPPNSIFGPVWIILYTLMGISLHIVNQSKVKIEIKRDAQKYFFIQLLLNTLWSVIFFGTKMPNLAFFEIVFLWIAIALTIIKFYKINKVSGLLLIPYLAWVTFASLLNLSIASLN